MRKGLWIIGLMALMGCYDRSCNVRFYNSLDTANVIVDTSRGASRGFFGLPSPSNEVNCHIVKISRDSFMIVRGLPPK